MFPVPVLSAAWMAVALGRHMPHGGNVGAAVTLAVASTGCYASSAALQEREAARQRTHGESVLRLLRRPWWWLAVIMVAAGGLLHIAALALGPVSLVQPLGVLTLVFALPLGARLARRSVTRQEAHAAAAVALGLAAVVTVMPHHALATHLPLAVILSVAGLVAAVTLLLVGIATRLLRRAAPVVHAAAAATCFGFASVLARITVTGTAPFLLAASLAVLAAVAGLGLVQLAYRTGGLGAPLATLNLVDPMVAVLIGVTLLGEPVQLTGARAVLGVIGLAATAAGIGALTRSAAAPVATMRPW